MINDTLLTWIKHQLFSMVPNKTLNVAGEQSINVRRSTGSTMRLTCAVTVSAAGDILRPFIVFKGKRDGRIAREFQNPEKSGFTVDYSYICQDRAWMDEAVMLQSVKKCLNHGQNMFQLESCLTHSWILTNAI